MIETGKLMDINKDKTYQDGFEVYFTWCNCVYNWGHTWIGGVVTFC